jgi:pimeloyl-ACP methyl ester carboxylesterase
MSELAVVLCHGSYHTPAPYEPFIEALAAQGIAGYCPQLPTSDLSKLNVGDVDNPDFDIGPPEEDYPQGQEDAAVVLQLITDLVDNGKKVVIIGHSSGGWVATQSALPEFRIEDRKEKGLPGGVLGILYVGAFVIPVGESVHSFFQPKDGSPPVTPPFMQFHKHGPGGLGTMVEPEKFLFHDVDATVAQKYTKTLTASPILTTRLTNDGYSLYPCAYLVLDGDRMLPAEYQMGMVTLQQSKQDTHFHIYHCPAGHSPHLSWTDGLVLTAQDFIRSF